MRMLISGGGTGGHIYPALAIAMEAKENNKDAQILYVGTENGLESKLVPKAGFDFKTVRVKGLPRKINLDFFRALKELFLGLRDSNKIIKEFKPDIVIGTGGYVSAPVTLLAALKGIPTAIHEQNAYPGITNKLLSKFVDRVFITYDEAENYFKNKNKLINTGNPLRSNIFTVNKKEAYKNNNLNPDLPIILSFGGSGGQKSLNDSMLYVLEKNKDQNIQIIHVAGERFYEDFINKLKEKDIRIDDYKNLRVLPYLHNMPEIMNISDLVITSSGAITLAEISALSLPSILTPKAYTAENHQEKNAEVFYDNGAAEIIYEKELNGENLNEKINKLIFDKNKLEIMSKQASKLGEVEASKKIIREIEKLIETKGK